MSNDRSVRYQILVRRIRAIGRQWNIMPLTRPEMDTLARHCVSTLGEEGITDQDLYVLYRLTKRGLFNE